MKKRVIIRIGDVFCVECHDYKVFFQYVAIDATQLNSQVIRVFHKKYDINSNPSIEEIIKNKVDFYAHTVINIGVCKELWYKMGSCKDLGDINHIYFRLLHSAKENNWYVWRINEPTITIGELTEEYRLYDFGWIYACQNVIKRIKEGKYYVLNGENENQGITGSVF